MQGDRRNGGSELQERLHNNDRPASARKWLQPRRARAGPIGYIYLELARVHARMPSCCMHRGLHYVFM
jgi:hypothetical protein